MRVATWTADTRQGNPERSAAAAALADAAAMRTTAALPIVVPESQPRRTASAVCVRRYLQRAADMRQAAGQVLP